MYQFSFTTATTACLGHTYFIEYEEYIHKLKRKPRKGSLEVGPIIQAPKNKIKR